MEKFVIDIYMVLKVKIVIKLSLNFLEESVIVDMVMFYIYKIFMIEE